MVQIADVSSSENGKSKPKESRSVSWFLSLILFIVSFILLFLFITFLVLYIISSSNYNKLEKTIEGLKEDSFMTCEWLQKCDKKRSTTPLLVISMDGFAARYLSQKYSPTISKFGECGTRAEYMIPSFPTKTFPNHYTIATGLHPGYHGIVDNQFISNQTKYNANNGSFYGGEPIWNTVVKNGKESKIFLWLGSYDKIDGVEATFHFQQYFKDVTFVTRVEEISKWLSSDDPPALSMLYMEEPDGTGHQYGPDSTEIKQSLISVDGTFNYLLRSLHENGVLGCTNIIIVSDHGMRKIDKIKSIEKMDETLMNKSKIAKNSIMFYENVSLSALQCNKGEDYRVYERPKDVPLRYHYTHENIGFPLVVGNAGTMFFETEEEAEGFKGKGNHGWDNDDPDMRAIFLAMGPSINKNKVIQPFQNIELYNLFSDLLNIPGAPNNGTIGLLDEVLINHPYRVNKQYINPICDGISISRCNHETNVLKESNIRSNMVSRNDSVCTISTGNIVMLYDKEKNKTIGMEILTNNKSSSLMPYRGQIVVKMNNESIGPDCHDNTSSSIYYNKVPESILSLTWTSHKLTSIHKELIDRFTKVDNVLLQIGYVYGDDNNIKYIFYTGLWCRDNKWNKDMNYCTEDDYVETKAYMIPDIEENDFNCLSIDQRLSDYRVTFGDIEKYSSISLLPSHISLHSRQRILIRLHNE